MLSIKHNENLPHAQPLFPALSPLCLTSCTSMAMEQHWEPGRPKNGCEEKKNDTPKGRSRNFSLCWNKAHLDLLFTFYSTSEIVENISFNILDKITTCNFLKKGFPYYSNPTNCCSSRYYWEKLRKYSSTPATEKRPPSRPGAHECTQMKLFTLQRNLYISGFSLFFWLWVKKKI